MSGGSYDYAYAKVSDAADQMRYRHPDKPHVLAFAAMLDQVSKVMHDIEWADSMDSVWDDKLDTDIRYVLQPGKVLDVTLAKAKEWHGKLAAEIATVSPPPGPGAAE